MRADALSDKLQNGNVVPFWKDIQSLRGSTMVLPKRMDGAIGEEAIASLWKNKFSHILNCVSDPDSMEEFFEEINLDVGCSSRGCDFGRIAEYR